jgi:phosphonatase-like hydrolase
LRGYNWRVPIRVVCLDMAGTTVTDDGAVERAFVEALVGERLIDEGELPGALDVVRRTMGQSKIDVFRALLRDEDRSLAANAAFEAAYDRAVARGDVGPVEGAEDVLRALRKIGMRVCLLTGFAPATREALIDALDWRDLIDLALSPADVGRGRPEPDLVLAAARHFGVLPSECAVVGDTVSDLLCGTRAGAAIVAGVGADPERRAELAAAPHTHLLDSVTELTSVVAEND